RVVGGAPIVAIPIAEDQPGVAARIQHSKIGVVVPFKQLSVSRLKDAIRKAMEDPQYRRSILQLQSHISKTGGVHEAADRVEEALRLARCNHEALREGDAN